MDDNMRAKARAVFGKEFMDIMKPKPLAKNEAVALQQRANARPIPTYKVGGAVKKDCGPMPKAGKVQKKADGGMMATANEDIRSRYRDMLAGRADMDAERAAKVEARRDRRAEVEAENQAKRAARQADVAARRAEAEAMRKAMQDRVAEVRNETRKVPDTRPAPQGGSSSAPANRQPSPPQPSSYGSAYGRRMGATPTRPGFMSGAAGLKHGGEAKKKMNGGPIADNMTAGKLSAPKAEKYAQGGAGKVRKGMMTQSGQITPGKPRGRM